MLRTMKPPREFYLPAGAVKIADKASDAVAYIFATPNGSPAAMMFYGTAAKPVWHFRFTSEAAREKRIADGFARRQAWDAAKAKSKAARTKPHNFQLGHLLSATWGYDQTNVDFYEVTRVVSDRSVEVRKVAGRDVRGEGGWSGRAVPMPGEFIGKPKLCRVAYGDSIRIDDVRRAYLWNGRPTSWTSYA